MDDQSDLTAVQDTPALASKSVGVGTLAEITFDEQDRNLFQVDDPRLRADAIRYSILPRMHVVLREAIALIRRVYGVDVFEDSIVSYFPHFRQKRDRELTLKYDHALVGLGGQRRKGKWPGLTRNDSKPIQIVPFRYAFTLGQSGLAWLLENWSIRLSDKSYRAVLASLVDNLEVIQSLCVETGMCPQMTYGGTARYLSPLRDQYRHMMDERHFDNHYFLAPEIPYPIGPAELTRLIRKYAIFFPVYDSFLQIAKGVPTRFDELVDRANDWLEAEAEAEEESESDKAAGSLSAADLARVAEVAAQRVPVMPAMRWRVFQRDKWRCVACGRRAHDGIILHVDHILPRSKGGPDTFENFQTLCSLCNGGKSNRDATDLREDANVL